jgi:hypothetical protein
MASTCIVAFNIDSQTIHSTLNIPIEQTLINLSNLSSNSLNRLTCWYEQLQLVVINKMSFVGARMFKVIDHWLRAIKHIQNKNFNALNVIMSSDLIK